MIFTNDTAEKAPEYAYVEEFDAGQKKSISSDKELKVADIQEIQEFEFPQLHFPLGETGVSLQLWGPLRLKVCKITGTFSVEGWPVKEMECTEVYRLPEKIARVFLIYLGKADSGIMEKSEKREWLSMLETIDFKKFSIRRSAPHYLEGKLLSKTPSYRVEWMDGSKEVLSFEIAKPLFLLEPGDEFSAYVKLGDDNKTLRLERLSILQSV